jgi:hypothetical protein
MNKHFNILLIAIALCCFSSCEDRNCDYDDEGPLVINNLTTEAIVVELNRTVLDTIPANSEETYVINDGSYNLDMVGLTSGQTWYFFTSVAQCETDQIIVEP